MMRKLIFLADDDRDDTEMFSEALVIIDDSIECRCFINGEEILNAIKRSTGLPDLIFLDLNMPVVDGWQCLAQLKDDTRYKDIPVIIISTSSHQEGIDRAMKAGALCYFVKPDSYDGLKAVLEGITESLYNGLSGLGSKPELSNYLYTFQPL